eukprot:SAG11_NODE_34072_length_274_cov_0.571429_2_plen_33_part_01
MISLKRGIESLAHGCGYFLGWGGLDLDFGRLAS